MAALKTEVWVAWLAAAAASAVTVTFVLLTFAYGQFESKEHAKEVKEDLKAQLSRMESKIDVIGGFQQGHSPDGK